MSTTPYGKGRRPRVLTISDMYPRPLQPQFAIFVEQQNRALARFCDIVVLSPIRPVPPLSVFRSLPSLRGFRESFEGWRDDMNSSPREHYFNGLKVYRPRYFAPPRHPTYGLWGFFAYPALLPLLRRLHAEQPFDLIHAHNAAPSGLIGMLAQRWMKVPLVLTLHGVDFTDTIPRSAAGRRAIEGVFRRADVLLANSSWTTREAIRFGANPDATRVLFLGADGDLPESPPHRLARPSADTVRLLTVSRLIEWKGIQWVLRAMRKLRDEGMDVTYTVVGRDDSYGAALRALTKELDLEDCVHFTGEISRDEIWRHYANADLFVLPSYIETFGIVFVEALRQGLAVIGSDIGGAVDIHGFFPDGVELVPPRDPVAVAGAIRSFMADLARRERVRQNGPRIVIERFTWERTAREILTVYDQLLEPRSLLERAGVN